MISLVYPYSIAYEVTPEKIKSDLAYLGRKIRKEYPKGYFFYLIDYSGDAGFHIHLFGRAGKAPRKLKKLRIKKAFPQWWTSRLQSTEKHLIKVGRLRTMQASHKACSYLLKGDKFNDHLRVTSHLGNKHSFGCFNKHNVKYARSESLNVSLGDFPEIRKLIALNTHEDSKRTSDSYLCDHDHKVMNAGSGLHIINDPTLAKKIKRKLARLKQSKRRKK
ncbi:hypothetical protein DWB63_11805 [Pseudodesulfovibrio sp. S3]|nr:hypothetical protein DWB63_11805 [Pseudodesulfovibrio sp. S3]